MSKYVDEARVDDPSGKDCSFCGTENDLADDLGWFYLHPGGTMKPPQGYSCLQCYEGLPGQQHRKKYGRGER